MTSGVLAAITVCCALAGSVAVSVLATKDLPRDEAAPAAVVEQAPAVTSEPRVAPRRAARSTPVRQGTAPHPPPQPLDRGR